MDYPKAANATLVTFYENKGNLLSEKSYTFIWKIMRATETGAGRIAGALPKGTVVAQKTG
ncbi:MAG: hypothetical protein EAY75_11880 [Bacteroidetes bacterium]|nr:MAG: hypothetical protein EAY75_11880 [Bacteroidota bacterium]